MNSFSENLWGKLRRGGLVAGAGLALLAGLTARSAPPAPSPYSFYERYVAIDAVCAWPNLHVLPSGDLAVLIWPYDSHGMAEGAVECWISRDHGVKWSRAGVPVPAGNGVSRVNVAGGVVDGKLVAIVGGFAGRPPYEEGMRFWSSEQRAKLAGHSIEVAVAVSEDGRTWSPREGKGFLRGPYSDIYLIPYGRIGRLADGAMAALLYADGVSFYASRDDGHTWTRRGYLSPPNAASKRARRGDFNESTWVTLANGDLYAAARSFPREDLLGAQSLDGFRSTDGGVTWTREQELAPPNQIPADLMRLPDDRLLLTYSSRNPGSRAIWVRFGSPDARAWGQPHLLVDLEGSAETQYPNPKADGGYPSTVLAADGTFVTVYYSRGIPAHQRYHMGVVRWRLRGGKLETE